MNNETQIIPSFKDSLFDDNAKEILKDVAELGIDSVMEDGITKDIPIVGTLVTLGKLGVNIQQRNLLKQTLTFIETFNSGNIDKKKLNDYKEKINNHPKKAEDELGRIIILLNNNIDSIKSEILANFYLSYVNEYINWDRFCELSDASSRLFISDLTVLFSVYKHQIYIITDNKSHRIERLIAIGLLQKFIESKTRDDSYWPPSGINIFDGNSKPVDSEWHVKITSLGQMFCQYSKYSL